MCETFEVIIERLERKDGLVFSNLYVNSGFLGLCFENDNKEIPAGSYAGLIRTTSTKNFVQRPGGVLGNSGDFLLEIAGVPGRTDILFHPGNKPEHSDGCVLGGAALTVDGKKIAPEALKKLRLAFFRGEDVPTQTPNWEIKIAVTDYQ